jgi:hypothetical protein
MINNFFDFKQDFIFENIINESIIYFSPDLRKIITKLSDSSKIAKDLISIEETDIKPDITFIDLDKEGYLSFSTMKNAKKLIELKFKNIDGLDRVMADELWSLDKRGSVTATGVYTKSRNPISIGKFINKVLPNRFTEKEREEFVNSFKSTIEKSNEEFILVSGSDIAFWYNKDNYKTDENHDILGTLGNSCMSSKNSEIFDLYVRNPDVCQLLILVEDEKLIGRALVWKLDSIKGSNFDYFMDRQYTIKESDVEKFRNYAKSNNWGYKEFNNHYSFKSIIFRGESHKVDMCISLSDKRFLNYPYMDTFRRYDPSTGNLYNDNNPSSVYGGQYLLDDTDGDYTYIEEGVYSEWYGDIIDENDAIWSEKYETYILKSDSVEVTRSTNSVNIGVYPNPNLFKHRIIELKYSELNDEWIHQDDAIWSRIYNGYIYIEDVVVPIESIESDGNVRNRDEMIENDMYYSFEDNRLITIRSISNNEWYKFISKRFENWEDYDYIRKTNDCLIKDYKSNYIPTVFKIDTYSTNSGDLFLTEIDALILGYDIDLDKKIIMCEIEYLLSIDNLLSNLKNRLESKIEEFSDILINSKNYELKDIIRVHGSPQRIRQDLNRYSDRLERIKDLSF